MSRSLRPCDAVELVQHLPLAVQFATANMNFAVPDPERARRGRCLQRTQLKSTEHLLDVCPEQFTPAIPGSSEVIQQLPKS